MTNFVRDIVTGDIEKQAIDHETTDKAIDELWEAARKKGTSGKLARVLYTALLIIARQRLEIERLKKPNENPIEPSHNQEKERKCAK